MRFTQLPVGASFEYQNKHYSKVGPLTAINLDNNQQRMIPRSALITPLSGSGTANEKTSAVADKPLDPMKVAAAFEQYHGECLLWLQQEDRSNEELRERLERARQQFLAQSGIG